MYYETDMNETDSCDPGEKCKESLTSSSGRNVFCRTFNRRFRTEYLYFSGGRKAVLLENIEVYIASCMAGILKISRAGIASCWGSIHWKYCLRKHSISLEICVSVFSISSMMSCGCSLSVPKEHSILSFISMFVPKHCKSIRIIDAVLDREFYISR